jgi:ABC-type Fe3+/spermidine/putrescine transport system ATPase subunit
MLSIKNVSFNYKEKRILSSISFFVKKGDCLSVVGGSGSGKSTLLKLIYGKMDVSSGVISWNGQSILGPKNKLVVGHDFMKYVAQEFDLMPYISVAENIGAYLSNFFPEKKQTRINELLKVVELEAFSNTKVKFLSGGQKQRVALARAIAKQPEIILLDEPFSHIDNFKKQSLRKKFFRYLKSNSITCVVATHDKEDVLPFSDTMIVLENREVLVEGNPLEIYNNPRHPLVAAFFGDFSVINNTIYYSHQVFVVKKSDLKAVIKQVFYKGSFFLIEAEYNNTIVCFNHTSSIPENTEVYLETKL